MLKTAVVTKQINLLNEFMELKKVLVGEEIYVSPEPLQDGTFIIRWNGLKSIVTSDHFELL